jgi:hypothetical protein
MPVTRRTAPASFTGEKYEKWVEQPRHKQLLANLDKGTITLEQYNILVESDRKAAELRKRAYFAERKNRNFKVAWLGRPSDRLAVRVVSDKAEKQEQEPAIGTVFFLKTVALENSVVKLENVSTPHQGIFLYTCTSFNMLGFMLCRKIQVPCSCFMYWCSSSRCGLRHYEQGLCARDYHFIFLFPACIWILGNFHRCEDLGEPVYERSLAYFSDCPGWYSRRHA